MLAAWAEKYGIMAEINQYDLLAGGKYELFVSRKEVTARFVASVEDWWRRGEGDESSVFGGP